MKYVYDNFIKELSRIENFKEILEEMKRKR